MDGLACYLPLAQQAAREEFFHETLVWAVLAPHQKEKKQPPELPALLRI